MQDKLNEVIENGIMTEDEIVDFLIALKKLSKEGLLDSRNYKMVLDFWGIKKKKKTLKFPNGTKYKIK